MAERLKIGILEDHIATAMGYRSLLEKNPKLELCWMSSYYNQVEPNLKDYPTDLLILDVGVKNAPEDTAPFPILYVIPKILERYPEIKIIVISMHLRPALIKATVKAGASGYIVKDDEASFEMLDDILLNVAQGDIYYSPDVDKMLAQPEETPILTPRQSQILSYLSSQPTLSTQELSEKLHIAPSTIRNHLATAYLRLGVKRLASAITKAQQLGLIATGDEALPPIEDLPPT